MYICIYTYIFLIYMFIYNIDFPIYYLKLSEHNILQITGKILLI